MAKLYEAGHTLIDWSERSSARGQVVAWAICQPHQTFPYKVETLRDMSGSIATVKDFKQKLKRRSTH
jgi:hypothetical protein